MCESTLKSSYDSEVRPLIDLIDHLRSFGLESDVNLPAVAVIGDQSAGKSSVLEAISGVQLPRGTGIVTRCPLMMRMKRLKPGKPWEGHIVFTSKDGHTKRISIPDQEEVGTYVKKAQVDITGNQKGISEELIELEVASPEVPDLTLIDLPGIARNAVEGQPENIEELIKGLIKKYISRQTTIILAVLQCTVDLATCEAIKMARAYDVEGTRTLGVLTMPDRVEQGAEDQVMGIMANELYPLSKGYIMVKCRSQTAVKHKQTLRKALEDEKRFFETHEHFSTLRDSQRGIDSLSARLTKELKSHIQTLIPKLEADIAYKLSIAEAKLRHFGPCPTTDMEKRHTANELVTRFSFSLKRLAKGEPVEDVIVPDWLNSIFSDARKAFNEFHSVAAANKPDVGRVQGKLDLKAELEKDLDLGRGRELPDFSAKFGYVEKYAQIYLGNLYQPAIACFGKVHILITKAYIELANCYFERYRGFAAKALAQMKLKAEDIDKEGQKEIDRYFTMEKGFVFTQDSTYTKILHEEGRRMSQDDPVTRIIRSLVSYYKVAMTRISDHIPLIIHQRLFREEVDVIIEDLKVMVADDSILNDICEDEQVAQQRVIFMDRYKRLSLAMQELSKLETVQYLR